MNQLHKRVVVTGLGILSPIGNTVQDAWSSCINGESGITTVDIDLKKCPISVGGRLKDFNPEQYLDPKEVRRIDPFIQYGVIAANQSISDSGILEFTGLDHSRVGVNFGAGIGGIDTIEKNKILLELKSFKKVSPFFVPGSIINMISGLVSIKHGFMGPNISAVTACSTGNHCIGNAARFISYGDADVMIAGGAEMASTPLSIAGFLAARALTKNQDPKTASRPWDLNRDGFVLSDGAGSLVLEEYDHAKKRNANIYAEIIGFGMSSDAYHMTAPPEDGRGAELCMLNALDDAKINSEDVNYINAHGTSTLLGDLAETIALKKVFSSSVPSISSTKSMTGHTLGAAGAIESIFSIKSINDGIIPPTINLLMPDPKCNLDYTPIHAVEKNVSIAINNSFGFGGTNSTLVFQKYNLFISLFLVFIFLIILYGSVESYTYSRVTKDHDTYTINQGDTINKIFDDVGLNFVEKVMIKLYLKFNNINIIQAGHYDLVNKNWRTFIDNLSNGFIKEFLLQIPEGSNLYDIKNIIDNSYLELDCPNFICLDKQFGFYEGTLMPDTYFYKFKSSLASILVQSQNDFFIYTRNLWINRNLKNPLKNLSQAIILASIVEKEAGNDLEKPIIAGVFLHRINLNMKLQADPTIIYGLMPDFNGNITKANINDKNNPYNTYQIMGLPPTPISTISKTSLEAVILGQANEYLYFVAKGDGTHYFSKDYNEHLNSVKKYQLNK